MTDFNFTWDSRSLCLNFSCVINVYHGAPPGHTTCSYHLRDTAERSQPGHNTFICSKQVSRQWSVKLLRRHKTVCICHPKTKQCWDLGPLPVLDAEDTRGLQSGCKVLAVLTLHFNISNKPLRLLLECKTKHHTFNTKTQALLVDLLKLTNITIYMLWNDSV